MATYSDPTNTANLASDFIAQIDWGDVVTTAGTVQGSAGSFSIVGSHAARRRRRERIRRPSGGALTDVAVAAFADASGSHAASDYIPPQSTGEMG